MEWTWGETDWSDARRKKRNILNLCPELGGTWVADVSLVRRIGRECSKYWDPPQAGRKGGGGANNPKQTARIAKETKDPTAVIGGTTGSGNGPRNMNPTDGMETGKKKKMVVGSDDKRLINACPIIHHKKRGG